MASPVTRLLAAEHAESRAKLMACHLCNGEVDLRRFDDFRQALPRHIAIEEKVLMPALTKVPGKAPLFQNGLQMDHAGIAALCIPTPTSKWLDDLKELLEHHQRVEEAPESFHALVAGRLHILEAVSTFPQLELPGFVRARLENVLALTGITSGPRPSRPRR